MHLNLSFFLSCCAHPFGIVSQKIFPVFEPNEYFWKKHWEPVKDKEDKATTFARCVRAVMIKYGGFLDAPHKSESLFEYRKAYRKIDFVEEE